MGQAAALDVGARMKGILKTRDNLSMVFAAAPSQNEFLVALSTLEGIAWNSEPLRKPNSDRYLKKGTN
jgi:glucosamine-6-phosphate deaminase